MTTRESFLGQVRQAVQSGNRAGQAPALEARGSIGFQGAGPDPVASFCQQFVAAGGQVHRAVDVGVAAGRVLEILRNHSARKVLLGCGDILDRLELGKKLAGLGIDVVPVARCREATCREPFFAADVGISGVDYLVAESGTIVVRSRLQEPRSLTLLPPVHIAVASRDQVLPDLFDVFGKGLADESGSLPSCVIFITGPSKTGDIELRLVTGVHGPGEVHVVLLENGN
jgi:L-lactate dehydrogenase complex protein LldG